MEEIYKTYRKRIESVSYADRLNLLTTRKHKYYPNKYRRTRTNIPAMRYMIYWLFKNTPKITLFK